MKKFLLVVFVIPFLIHPAFTQNPGSTANSGFFLRRIRRLAIHDVPALQSLPGSGSPQTYGGDV